MFLLFRTIKNKKENFKIKPKKPTPHLLTDQTVPPFFFLFVYGEKLERKGNVPFPQTLSFVPQNHRMGYITPLGNNFCFL